MKAKILVVPTMARAVAARRLGQAAREGHALVSDRCVFDELLKQAKEKEIELEFFIHDNQGGRKILNLPQAWAVIEGRHKRERE